MKRLAVALAALALLTTMVGPAAEAQDNATDVEGVVVTARRIGVPVWRVTSGGSTVVLIGQIQGVPKDAAWRPQELERAVAGADSVLFPHDIHASPADMARILLRARSVVLLPKNRTLADYLDADALRRMRALRPKEAGSRLELRWHPWFVADELMEDSGAGELFGDDRVADVVARAARKHRKKREAVGYQRASRILDAYFADPAAHTPCLLAALDAAEAGRTAARERLQAWTRSRVPEVVASPIERAQDVCWPNGPERRNLRADWRGAVDKRLNAPGVTVAVAPLLYLAEDGGVLDGLAARGLEIDGPRWRRDGG